MDKPFSQASENNKAPILEVLKRAFSTRRSVLEIGSGTGQHAVYFAEHLPHLQWRTSDLAVNHAGINQWIDDRASNNVVRPVALDAGSVHWRVESADAAFSANTLHIMSWTEVESLFAGLDKVLLPDAVLAIYGPFNYDGAFTSESNARFNKWLKSQASHRAIRDFEAVNRLAHDIGFLLEEDNAMPANNRLLVWRRSLA